MAVRFTPQARDDLLAIREWIETENRTAAEHVVSRIVQSAMSLGQFPHLGRGGQISGTRELSVGGLPYLVVYSIASDRQIDVLTVLHTRRQYPPLIE